MELGEALIMPTPETNAIMVNQIADESYAMLSRVGGKCPGLESRLGQSQSMQLPNTLIKKFVNRTVMAVRL